MLSPDERKTLGKQLLACFKLYGRDLAHDSIVFMVDALSEYPLEKSLAALKKYAVTEKTGRAPTIGQLVDLINPQASTETLANDAASRIFQAIARFGWPDPDGARAFIGELGWSVVRRFGGWQYVCENHGDEINVTTFHAQARELAKAQIELGKLGMINDAPQLPSQEKKLIDEGFKAFDVKNLVAMKTIPK